MKNSLPILAAAIFLTACSLGPEQSPNDTSPADPAEIVQNQLDAQTTIEAINERNLDLCSAIESEEMKSDCELKVQDHIILDDARFEINKSKCEEIEQESTKLKCEGLVQTQLDKAAETEKINEEQQLLSDIVSKGNIGQCSSLEDPAFIKQCETNTYLQQASEQQDPSICDKIEEEDLIELCKLSATFESTDTELE